MLKSATLLNSITSTMYPINLANNHRQVSFCNTDDSSGLILMQINIRGMNQIEKLDSLGIFLQNLPIAVDVLVIGETWIKEDRSRYYNIPGFQSTYSCRIASSGGLAVFIREGLNFEVKKVTTDSGFHHIAIDLQLRTSHVMVHAIYRPPGYDVNQFLSFLENNISSMDTRVPYFLLGDTNLAINNRELRVAQRYVELLASYNMIVSNTYITRPVSNNILDHVVCRADISDRITNYTLDCDLSDHCIVLTHFKTTMEKISRTLLKTWVNYRLVNAHFQSFLECYDFTSLTPNERLLAITQRYVELSEDFKKTYRVQVKLKANYCPWFNFDIWKLGKISNSLFQSWKRNRHNQHIKNLLTHANKKLAEAKRHAKSVYYQRFFSASNPKQLWSRINDLMGKRAGQEKQCKLVVDGVQINRADEVGNVFNNFFSSIGENIANNLNSDGDINKFGTMEISARSIFLRPANHSEVFDVIHSLDSSKATGVDGFPVRALKQHGVALSNIICSCFNDSISTGIYPECLKKALVHPIFKGGDPTNPTNYRPISVLPAINKVFEKLLYTRLFIFLESTDQLYQRQFGFRQGSSTEMAVLELVDDVSHSVDQKLVAGVLFLDLSKAFDTINHALLLKKLDAYGIRGIANELLRSYLAGRQQKVVISGSSSEYRTIKCGVPQGSNLGPLLFLIYVNDIAKLQMIGQPRLFADDTAISYKCRSVYDLYRIMSNDLQLVMAYLENNLLSLNLKKTKIMVFGAKDNQVSPYPVLSVNGETIEEVSSFKYLPDKN